jgi:hypothetical protein
MSEPGGWYLRKEAGGVYGPVDLPTLRAWAADGRVAPEDYLSTDQQEWRASFEVGALEMDWLLELEEGLSYGPAHRQAFEGMLAEGALQPPLRLRNQSTGEILVLGEDAAPPEEPVSKGDTQKISRDEPAPMSEAAPEPPPEPESPASEPPLPASEPEPPAPALEPMPPAPEPEASAPEPEPTAPEPAIPPGPSLPPPPEPPPPPPLPVEPASAPEPAPGVAEPPAPVAPPERTLTWQAIARERDRFEREAAKWKSLLEQEGVTARAQAERLAEITRRAEEDQLASSAEIERLRREIEALQKEPRAGDSAAATGDANLLRAYRDLMVNYDVLTRQLADKNEELRQIQEELATVRADSDTRVRLAEDQARREKSAVDTTRRRLQDLERTHAEIVQSYRDMNDRYIQMREQLASGVPAPVPGAPESDAPAPPQDSGPRIRLRR